VPLSLKAERVVAEALSQSNRLVTLDQLWTFHLNEFSAFNDPTIRGGDAYELREIAQDMVEALNNIEVLIPNLRNILFENSGDLQSGLESIRRSQVVPDDVRDFLFNQTRVLSSTVLQESIQKVAELIPEERGLLEHKIEILRSGRFVPGDLTASFLCQLSIMVFGAALMLPFPSGLPGLLVGAAIVLFVYHSGDTC
jgi:hypothetical protein